MSARITRGIPAAVLIAAAALLLSAAPAQAQTVVANFTRFAPVAQGVVVPAGQAARFTVDARNYSRVSLLVAGETRPDAGPVVLSTLFGPPLVPGGERHPLPVGPEGRIAVSFIQPVFGPQMVVVVHNDSAADARLTISAYLSN